MNPLVEIGDSLVRLSSPPTEVDVAMYGRRNSERYNSMKVILLKYHYFGLHEDFKMKQQWGYLPSDDTCTSHQFRSSTHI